jgi:hypothetical protein
MPKFYAFAQEVVYYMKEVEGESVEQIKKMIFDGEIDFDYGDVTDAHDFQIIEIEEVKRYA